MSKLAGPVDLQHPTRDLLRTWLVPWFVGVLMATWMSGYLLSELVLYLRRFGRSDSTFLRLAVGLTALFSLLHDLEVWAIGVTKFATGFGDLNAFITGSWLTYGQPPLIAAATLVTHIFFVVRCYRCLGRGTLAKAVVAVMCPLCLASFSAGVAVGAINSRTPTVDVVEAIRSTFIFWLVVNIAADLLIATVLLYFLWAQIRDTRQTQSLIDRLVLLTFSTLVPPLLCTISVLALFLALPYSSIYLPFISIQGKLYSMSLFHTLNMRSALRADLQATKHLATVTVKTTSSRSARQYSSSSSRTKTHIGADISPNKYHPQQQRRAADYLSQHTVPLTTIQSLDRTEYPMDDPSNWRGDQDVVDLESWRRAGFGEFDDEEEEVEGGERVENEVGRTRSPMSGEQSC